LLSSPEAYKPLNIPADQLVLAPHIYGPDAFMKASFSAANFPANLPADWDTLFGQFTAARAVVIGEFGGYGTGSSGQQDVVWQNAFVQHLQGKGLRNSFLRPRSPERAQQKHLVRRTFRLSSRMPPVAAVGRVAPVDLRQVLILPD
jgi:hypothetical protein